jgi:hypothetical protein
VTTQNKAADSYDTKLILRLDLKTNIPQKRATFATIPATLWPRLRLHMHKVRQWCQAFERRAQFYVTIDAHLTTNSCVCNIINCIGGRP